MALIQAASTFMILLSSSVFAAHEIKYNDGTSLAPAEGMQVLCDRASLLALQGLENVSRALSDLKAQPSENISIGLLSSISDCLDGLRVAKSKIQQAMKEGPEVPPSDYELPNRYDSASEWSLGCSIGDPIAHEVTATYKVAASLINNAKELCS